MVESPLTMHTFSSPEVLADTLADETANRLADAISARGQASLVVSGGSTPRPFFNRLSRTKISWGRVTVTLADERWVDTGDDSSNEHLVRSELLRNEAACARFIGLKNAAHSAAAGEKECNDTLRTIPRPFDLVILGMGSDGHTASFFPGAGRLPEAVDMQSGRSCIALTPPGAPFKRMTLTMPELLNSRIIILHITGEEKKQVLEKALAEGEAMAMPVRFVLRQRQTPVHIYWAG